MVVPILAYHKVSNRFEWGINNVSIQSFENQINYLSENHYYTISLEQFLKTSFQIDSKRRPVVITFDDGDESIYHNAFPILEQHRFTATIFVISNYVGKLNSWDANLGRIYSRHLCWDQIIELLKAGWEIGSHTATHRDLLGLSPDESKYELQSSRERIEQQVERPIPFISYPFNRYDRRIISLAQQVGYTGGCGLSPQSRLNGAPQEFNIQRYGVYAIDNRYAFEMKLSNSKIEQFKQRIISFASIGTILYHRYRK